MSSPTPRSPRVDRDLPWNEIRSYLSKVGGRKGIERDLSEALILWFLRYYTIFSRLYFLF